jgi:hypothetical protein
VNGTLTNNAGVNGLVINSDATGTGSLLHNSGAVPATFNRFINNGATVSTTAITEMTFNSATGGGNVTNDGGATVTVRGVCCSTSPNPTTVDSHTTDGSGTGVFTSSLTGLTANMLYYVRAYASNSFGTSYGSQVQFNSQPVCGTSFTINHTAGTVAPVTKTVTYGTVAGIPGETAKCWITSNLGSDHQATSVDDATEASAGWYWQFNRTQGYKHDGSTRTPSTIWNNSISENSVWLPANDPCSIEFSSDWRLPTLSEWNNVIASGSWANWSGPWNSGLKLHAAGFLAADGNLTDRGILGHSWSSNQQDDTFGKKLDFYSTACYTLQGFKFHGFPIRCVRNY